MRYRFSLGRPIWMAALAVVLGCVMGWGTSFAQCIITGPSSTCGTPIQLCGPNGPFEYEWTGPGGFSASTQCVSVSAPGTYSLRIFNFNNGLWFGPCTHDVTGGGAAPACQITGSSTVCSGSTTDLCGPAGSFTYAWTGPNGFTATTQCVSVGRAGTYSLVVSGVGGTCASAPCQITLTVNQCQTSTNCPRTASFWRRQCGGGAMTHDQMRQAAQWVDAHSRAFEWQNDMSGLCQTLDRGHCSMRGRAQRQFAALLTNVAANALNLKAADGSSIGIDPKTEVAGVNGTFTLQSWIDQADARLVGLGCRNSHRPDAVQSFRNIAAFARMVNHGHGIGEICQTGSNLSVRDDDDDDATLTDANDE